MRVLFLDLDGPLWSDRVIRHHPDNDTSGHPKYKAIRDIAIQNGDTFLASCLTYWKMDDVAVHFLNKLMPFTTVISSSWRELASKETLEYIFEVNNLKLQLHSDWSTKATPRLGWEFYRQNDRLGQIVEWFNRHKDEISDYAILDDPSSGGSLVSDGLVRSVGLDPTKVILVNPEIGLELEHCIRLQELLT